MLNRGRLIGKRNEGREDISPMESLVNLTDMMLVFICGLLISIIIFWNVDMDNIVIIYDESQLVKIENPEEMEQQMEISVSSGELGTAVLDPDTGEIFVIDDIGKATK